MSLDPDRPGLRNALLTWCFEERVEDLMELEVYFRSQDLAALGFPNMGGASNRREPVPIQPGTYDGVRRALEEAWKGLLLDFQKRIERGELHLRGVQTEPERHLVESVIPPQWAA